MKRQWVMPAMLAAFFLCIPCREAAAYIGPGAGLSAIGAFLAIFAGIVVALFGFLWYPIKKLLRKRGPRGDENHGGGE